MFIYRALAALLILGFLVLLVYLTIRFTVLTTTGPLDGNITVPDLTGQVTVLHEDQGVPHIYATDSADNLTALGFLHARDRLWQLHLYQLAARGNLSSLLGDAFLVADQLSRSLQISADDIQVDNTILRQLQAYTDGINRFIQDYPRKLPPEFTLSGERPELWEPEDVLNLYSLYTWTSAGHWQNLLGSELLLNQLPDALRPYLRPDLVPDCISRTIPLEFTESSIQLLTADHTLRLVLNFPANAHHAIATGSLDVDQGGLPLSRLTGYLQAGENLSSTWYESVHHILGSDFIAGFSVPGIPAVFTSYSDQVSGMLSGSNCPSGFISAAADDISGTSQIFRLDDDSEELKRVFLMEDGFHFGDENQISLTWFRQRIADDLSSWLTLFNEPQSTENIIAETITPYSHFALRFRDNSVQDWYHDGLSRRTVQSKDNLHFPAGAKFARSENFILASDGTAGQSDFSPLISDNVETINELMLSVITDDEENLFPDILTLFPYLQNWNFNYAPHSVAATITETFLQTISETSFRPYDEKEILDDLLQLGFLGRENAIRLLNFHADARQTGAFSPVSDAFLLRRLNEVHSILTDQVGPETYEWRWGNVNRAGFRSSVISLVAELRGDDSILSASNNLLSRSEYNFSGHPDVFNYAKPGRNFDQTLPAVYFASDYTTLNRYFSINATGNSLNPVAAFFDDELDLWLENEPKTVRIYPEMNDFPATHILILNP